MGWISGSYDRLEARLLAELRAEAEEAAAAAAAAAAPRHQALRDLPPCVRRYLELAEASACEHK